MPRLCRLPIARLTFIDGDLVEAANLERQPLYAANDVGRPKASTARGWIAMMSPGIDVIAVDRFIDAANADELLSGHDLVVEGVDDLHAKRVIDEACARLHLPLVSGGVHGKEGQVLLLHTKGDGSALTRGDIFKGAVGKEQDGCDMRSVPIELIEEVGKRMAREARVVIDGTPSRNGVLHVVRASDMAWRAFGPPAV